MKNRFTFERPKQFGLFFFLLLFSLPALSVPQDFGLKMLEENRYELGLSMQVLIPNLLPDFEEPLVSLGPRGSIPIGKDAIEMGFLYGTDRSDTLYLLEAGYRYNITFPFIGGYAYAGAHYLKYLFRQEKHDQGGPVLGFMLNFPMSKGFTMGIGMKTYFPSKILFSVGGNLSFLL